MSELKPCPFCGGSDVRYSIKTVGVGYHAAFYCNYCHCYGPGYIARGPFENRNEIERNEHTKRWARNLWNKRADI